MKKRSFQSHLCINAIILSRQARDKHSESTQNQSVFSGGGPPNAVFQQPELAPGSVARFDSGAKNASLLRCHLILKMPSFCQDRLGADVGKALKKRDDAFFTQGVSCCSSASSPTTSRALSAASYGTPSVPPSGQVRETTQCHARSCNFLHLVRI